MRVAESSGMSAEQSQVVVGFDFTHSGHAALYRAVALVARAPFHVLHFACVVDSHAGVAGMPTKRVDIVYADEVRDQLASLVEQELRAHGADKAHFHIHVRISKHPAKEIL